jgi:hypothetical protein
MICFFGNVELHSNDSHREFETNENNIDESDDDEQLEENNDNSYTSEFSVELSYTDQKAQSDFKEKTCGCVRLYGKPCSCRGDWTVLTEYQTTCLETSMIWT